MMRTVYDAAHGLEAQLVVDMLAGEGIEAIVTGAGLTSAVGTLPTMGLVQVRVAEEDVERALAAIAAWRATPVEADPEEPPALPRRPARRMPWFVVGAVSGAAITFALMHPWRSTEMRLGIGDRVAERVVREGDRIVRVESDENRDGRMDQIWVYGSSEGSYLRQEDADFDGRFESESRYVNDRPISAKADHDGDGYDEYQAKFRNGQLVEETWTSPDSKQITLRRSYDGATPMSEIDSDGDGRLDTRRRHDLRGEIVASEPIAP